MRKNSDQMDRIIAAALKELEVEAEQGMPDVNVAWANFEKRVQVRESKHKTDHKKNRKRLALVVAAAIIILFSIQNQKVTAFKNEIYEWIGKDENNITIITEQENVTAENGRYTGLTFEEAQGMTIFHLVKPTYLPSDFENSPEIEVIINNYPLALVKMTYTGADNKFLSLVQENSAGEEKRNTFVPENVEVENIKLDNKNITLLKIDNSLSAKWTYNGIKYTLSANFIEQEILLEIIKNLK
ncbi:DUF4367 domain-containing protein [Zhaonella formicivorans]|uniref:DUF4367 domain-containing protein n=1 Tax=Zhaonella formicivorans TaxID=2528593 RepID=UPI001D10266B|nr:DUF4367 domain-containing protein [Zhaonella formicivorans]